MSFRASRVTFDTAGPVIIALPFDPDGVMVEVGSKKTADTENHRSSGAAGGGLQNCLSDSSTGSRGFNDRVISHWEGGSEVLRVNFTSFGTNQITFDVITPNSNYFAYMRYMG